MKFSSNSYQIISKFLNAHFGARTTSIKTTPVIGGDVDDFLGEIPVDFAFERPWMPKLPQRALFDTGRDYLDGRNRRYYIKQTYNPKLNLSVLPTEIHTNTIGMHCHGGTRLHSL
jgi:hypothetical protein